MKMIEIKLRSTAAEVEKLLARKERIEKKLEKALAKVEKLGCKWTPEERRAWFDTVETANGWMTNKKEIEMNGAWMDWHGAEYDLEDINQRIERLSARLDKQVEEVESYHKEIEAIADAKNREELHKVSLEQEQKEWAKDGITLENRYYGTTPGGKRFYIYKNNGWTDRSRHCFTLAIDGDTIFTSGEFWRCYLTVKNN